MKIFSVKKAISKKKCEEHEKETAHKGKLFMLSIKYLTSSCFTSFVFILAALIHFTFLYQF